MIKNSNLLMLLFMSIACERGLARPEEPIWGKENCARCRMVLSEKRYAVQRILDSGKIFFYDDMNCALLDPVHKNEGRLFVRPFGQDKWIPAETAMYSSGFVTPMNSGIGAMSSGGTLSFNEVKQIVAGQAK